MKKSTIIILCCGIIPVVSFALYLFVFYEDNDVLDNFTHYNNINEFDNVKYTIEDDMYVIAHLSTDYEKYDTDGLFYRVSYNDYILLDEIDAGFTDLSPKGNVLYKDTKNNKNKLYVHRVGWPGVTEYILDGANTTKKDLDLNFKEITSADAIMLTINEIKKVENDTIFLSVIIEGYDNKIGQTVFERKRMSIKCSLEDYICVED